MKNNPIEELRRMESPVTEEGWASIVNDPRYQQQFGQKPKMSPKGRAAIIAGAVALLVTVPILVKTLTHKASDTDTQVVPTEVTAPQPSSETATPTAPQTIPSGQTKTAAKTAEKPTITTTKGAASYEQSALTGITEARSQAIAPATTQETTPVAITPKAPSTVTSERPATTPSTPKVKTPTEPVKPSQTTAYKDETPKSEPEPEEPIAETDQFFVPSAFTPNGDGLNDLFYVKANFEPRNFELTVFTRNGERVFQTRDMNIGWDGMAHGNLLPSGMYVYLIKYKDSHGNEQQQQGQILLIP